MPAKKEKGEETPTKPAVNYEEFMKEDVKERCKAEDVIMQTKITKEILRAGSSLCSPVPPPDTAMVEIYPKGLQVCIVKPRCRIFDANLKKMKDDMKYSWAFENFAFNVGHPGKVLDHIEHPGVGYVTHVVQLFTNTPEYNVIMVPPEALGPSCWKDQFVFIHDIEGRRDSDKDVRSHYSVISEEQWAHPGEIRKHRTARILSVGFFAGDTHCLLRLEPPGLPDGKYCVFSVSAINDTAQWSKSSNRPLYHEHSTNVVLDTTDIPLRGTNAGSVGHVISRPFRGQQQNELQQYPVIYYPPRTTSSLPVPDNAYGASYESTSEMSRKQLAEIRAGCPMDP